MFPNVYPTGEFSYRTLVEIMGSLPLSSDINKSLTIKFEEELNGDFRVYSSCLQATLILIGETGKRTITHRTKVVLWNCWLQQLSHLSAVLKSSCCKLNRSCPGNPMLSTTVLIHFLLL